jgi:hypothetical protein
MAVGYAAVVTLVWRSRPRNWHEIAAAYVTPAVAVLAIGVLAVLELRWRIRMVGLLVVALSAGAVAGAANTWLRGAPDVLWHAGRSALTWGAFALAFWYFELRYTVGPDESTAPQAEA